MPTPALSAREGAARRGQQASPLAASPQLGYKISLFWYSLSGRQNKIMKLLAVAPHFRELYRKGVLTLMKKAKEQAKPKASKPQEKKSPKAKAK